MKLCDRSDPMISIGTYLNVWSDVYDVFVIFYELDKPSNETLYAMGDKFSNICENNYEDPAEMKRLLKQTADEYINSGKVWNIQIVVNQEV